MDWEPVVYETSQGARVERQILGSWIGRMWIGTEQGMRLVTVGVFDTDGQAMRAVDNACDTPPIR